MEQVLEQPSQLQNPVQQSPASPPVATAAPADRLLMRAFTQKEFTRRWPELRSLLHPATAFNGGEYETDDLLTMVQQGHAFSLGYLRNEVCEFVLILQTSHMPRKKILFIVSWGGNGMSQGFRLFYKEFMALAKRNGYQAVRGAMRPSMERYAKRMLPDLTNLYSIVETSL